MFSENQSSDRLAACCWHTRKVSPSLRIDLENIAKAIAANTGKMVQEVTDAMLERTALNPDEAREWGLVHDIKPELFEAGSEVISIQYQEAPKQ